MLQLLSPRVTATEAPGLKSSVPKLKGALALATRENPRAAKKTRHNQKLNNQYLLILLTAAQQLTQQ